LYETDRLLDAGTILAQRQTVLVAKQAASLDVLSGGRFRLGVRVGWNEVEFVGLNEDFRNRGRRSEEQVQVMQALWADQHVSFKGRWHQIDDAGINPLPIHRHVPVWFGGHHDLTLRRIAKWGAGWMMLAYPADDTAKTEFAKLHTYAREEGRDPASLGIEVWVSTAVGNEDDWREGFRFWRNAGVTHITLNSTFERNHHTRIASRSLQSHLTELYRYRNAVSDLL
jgi:probable F420-dependent oxidoreductase